MISSAENSKSSRNGRIKINNVFGNDKPILDGRKVNDGPDSKASGWQWITLGFLVGVGTKYVDSLPSEKEGTINNQYRYTTTFGETEYIVIVKESDTAKETITKKLERVISSDVSKSVFSEGEEVGKDNQRLNITIPIWEVIP